jgi:transcriptional regulator with XRE-family HTH domain
MPFRCGICEGPAVHGFPALIMEPHYAMSSVPRNRGVAGRSMERATSSERPPPGRESGMPNERLRATLADSDYDQRSLADELGLDHKSVQRWVTKDITPRRTTANWAAKILGVPPAWLWPELEGERGSASQAEIVTLYPHRSDVPRHLWLDLATKATQRIWLYANASLFLPEDNPESIRLIQQKAEEGTQVRILMADPDSPQCVARGIEERLFDAISARVRMALSYYAPLAGIPGVEFLLQKETLYNSIFIYDEEMLVNQHVYGMYGYIAPILHLRRMEHGDFFDMYVRSFERVWEVSSPIEQSKFWQQRVAAIRFATTKADA